MRVLITGGREFTDWERFCEVLDPYLDEHTLVIVHGANPRGADAMAERWATSFGVSLEPHPADWGHYGKKAGGIRNQEMVDLGADICLAFPDPKSVGTWDCVRRAKAAGIEVLLTLWEEQ